MLRSLVGSEMCIRDRYQRRVRGSASSTMLLLRVAACLLVCLAMADAAPFEPVSLDLGEDLRINDVCEGRKPFKSGDDCVAACPAGETPDGQTEYNADNTECQACPAGMFADHLSHICVENCPVFLPYTGGGDCLDRCPPGQTPGGQTTVDEGNTVCAACESGKFADHEAHVCVDSCPQEQPYTDGHDCLTKCPSGQAPDQENECHDCNREAPEYAHHEATPPACVTTCPSGQPYHDGKDCLSQCPRGQTPGGQTEMDEANKECKSCPSGKFSDHEAHVCVTECPQALPYNDGKDCMSTCPDGQAPGAQTVQNDDNIVCAPCPADTFSNKKDNVCVTECPSGQTPGSDGKNCKDCDAGLYADHVAHKCVEECPAGSTPGPPGEGQPGQVEVDVENKDCQPCESGKFADHAEAVCRAECPAERRYNDGKDCRTRCPSGQTPGAPSNEHGVADAGQTADNQSEDHTVCAACAEGKFADHDAHVCVDKCPDGQVPDANQDCVACPSGQFADPVGLECVDTCPDERKYNDGSNCVFSCPSGQTPDADPNGVECRDCESGKFADHTEHKCVATCPDARKYRVQGNCAGQCPSGQTTEEDEESISCAACAEGKFADHKKHKCVEACPSPRPYNDGRDCVATCPAGQTPGGQTEADGASMECADCAENSFADHKEHVCVTECPSHRKYNDGKDCRAKCPSGQTPEGQTSDNKSNANKICKDCEEGKFADHKAHVCVEELDCPSGTAANEETKDCEKTDARLL
eukprot:TRINITY_DN762_c0_g1_i1.p1 TRINITY_DN762_c0_g1~~TRINITY_DN762_c0_g1_i1.p1  ORF type:complete len:755 (-),score=142.77 TRINITY_DN762_c0_g1_i1:79-2343(-)